MAEVMFLIICDVIDLHCSVEGTKNATDSFLFLFSFSFLFTQPSCCVIYCRCVLRAA